MMGTAIETTETEYHPDRCRSCAGRTDHLCDELESFERARTTDGTVVR